MDDFERFKDIIEDQCIFYHKCLIPKNKFFEKKYFKNDIKNLILISSPRRMGNHDLMSMLDSYNFG